MPHVIHVDFSAEVPERAARFYRAVFEWKVEKWKGPTDYWLMTMGTPSAPALTGGIGLRRGPEDVTAMIIDVPSLDDYARKVQSAGGRLHGARQSIPGVGWLQMCRDTEGNSFGMMQADETAG